jgi:hypothetical protein
MTKQKTITVSLSNINDPSMDTQYRVSHTSQEHINRLMADISNNGLQKPIALERDGGTPNFNIVDGHHRYFAFEHLSQKNNKFLTIPAVVMSFASDYDREVYQFSTNEHSPVKNNDKETLAKFIRNVVYVHKYFGPSPSYNDYNKIVTWAKKEAPTHHHLTIHSVVKKVLEGSSTVSSKGTKSYIKGSEELINKIKNAFGNKWLGSSVKSVSNGWLVQVISQDSDATIKPGTALQQKSNHGAKALGVVYVGKIEGKNDQEIDRLRTKWLERLNSFNDFLDVNSNGKLKALDKVIILPQKDSELKSGVRYLTGKMTAKGLTLVQHR